MAAQEPRVLVLGLDAFAPGLLRHWGEAGELPFLQAFLEGAWSADLVAPPGLFVGATWPTLATGTCPSRHAAFCHIRPRPGNYRDEHFRSPQIEAPAFWQALGRAGRKAAVLDSPWSPLVREGPGVQAQSWGAHDSNEFETWPPEWADELRAQYGEHLREPCDAVNHTGQGLADMVQALKRRIRVRAEMLEALMAREAWDLVWAIFSEAHCAGHQLWFLHDPDHPFHDPAELARFGGDPLLQVYQELDSALARLVEPRGEEAHLVVFASHGIGPELGAGHLLPMVLERLDGQAPGLPARLFRWARGAWRALPPGLRKLLYVKSRDVVEARQRAYTRERAARRFYYVENNAATGAVRVNLRGREPEGKVEPGADYDAVCEEILAGVRSLVDDATGRPVVRRAYRVDEVFPGPRLEVLPDILIDWDQTLPVREVRGPSIGRVGGSAPVVRTGDHPVEATGLLMVRGPDVPKAQVGPPVPAVDLGPTIAAWLGVELSEVDGRPVPALVGGEPGPARSGWIGHVDGAEIADLELASAARP